jgi:hypothetical protein
MEIKTMQETQLVKYNAARKALAEAHGVDEVKEIRDKAEALRAYAVQAKDVAMQNWAAEIRVRAERGAGELLAEMPKQHGSRGVGKKVESPRATPLSKMRITKTQSSKWQKLAEPEEKEFESALQKIILAGKELTTAGVLREIKPQSPKPEKNCLDQLMEWLGTRMPNPAPCDGEPVGTCLLRMVFELPKTAENEKRFGEVVAYLEKISKFYADHADKLKSKQLNLIKK